MRKAAQALEWGRFLELACEQARTQPGKELVRALEAPQAWAPSLAHARLMQSQTQECAQLLDRDALWGPLTDLTDPLPALERLERGSVLELEELALLRRWLYAIDSWSETPRDELRGELFKKALARLPDVHLPIRVLDRVLTPEGELSENATPRLKQLYGELRALRREIGVILDQLLKTFSQKGVLQENFTDVRDGRYVLPVKISSQGEIDGIIYEASASRQTVFVEPREVAYLPAAAALRRRDARSGARALALGRGPGQGPARPALLRQGHPGHRGARLPAPADGASAAVLVAPARADHPQRGGLRRAGAHAASDRPQHRRQDGAAQDPGHGGLLRADGLPVPGHGPAGRALLRGRVRRPGRQPVDRGAPLELLGPRRPLQGDPRKNDAEEPGPDRRAQLGHRSRGGRGAGTGVPRDGDGARRAGGDDDP